MSTKTKRSSVLKFAVGALLVGVLGAGAGAAVAQVPTIFAPAGLKTVDGTPTKPMPTPTYAVNKEGETFGRADIAPSSEDEPDLIAAYTSDGKPGYVRKSELDAVSNPSFDSPAAALEWQESIAGKTLSVPVYLKDGTTVIGDFTIVTPVAE